MTSTHGVFSKAAQEIREKFKTVEEITASSTGELTYLQACLEEGLRMFPPTLGTLPRKVPDEGATICGRFVPGKTVVGVHHWSTYRSARNFKNPDQFCPERWLGDEKYAEDDKAAFQPFSFGPRVCIAKG
jgi:cytochrome P450